MPAFADEHVAAILRRDRHDGGACQGGVGGDNQRQGEIRCVAADEKGTIVAPGMDGQEGLCHALAEIPCALGEERDAGEIFLKVSDVATIKEQRLQGGEGSDGLLQGKVVNLRGFGK